MQITLTDKVYDVDIDLSQNYYSKCMNIDIDQTVCNVTVELNAYI